MGTSGTDHGPFDFFHFQCFSVSGYKYEDMNGDGDWDDEVECPDGSLPLLIPMSEVAGRMAVQVGAQLLEKTHGGRGKLLGGVPGVRPADVSILGGGVVGSNAAQMALGLGAHVMILDIDTERLRYLEQVLSGRLTTPAPIIVTSAGRTPGTPPRSFPRPPRVFSRYRAPIWIDMRPATSLIGVSIGRFPSAVSTVS